MTSTDNFKSVTVDEAKREQAAQKLFGDRPFTKEAEKAYQQYAELIKTEVTYCNGLIELLQSKEMILAAYAQAKPEELRGKATLDEVNQFFKVIEEITNNSKELLHSLQNSADPSKWASLISSQQDTYSRYSDVLDAVNKGLPQTLEAQFAIANSGKTFRTYYKILPAQRGPRYQMMFDNLLKDENASKQLQQKIAQAKQAGVNLAKAIETTDARREAIQSAVKDFNAKADTTSWQMLVKNLNDTQTTTANLLTVLNELKFSKINSSQMIASVQNKDIRVMMKLAAQVSKSKPNNVEGIIVHDIYNALKQHIAANAFLKDKVDLPTALFQHYKKQLARYDNLIDSKSATDKQLDKIQKERQLFIDKFNKIISAADPSLAADFAKKKAEPAPSKTHRQEYYMGGQRPYNTTSQNNSPSQTATHPVSKRERRKGPGVK